MAQPMAGDWDGYLRVPAVAAGPGQWLTCEKGAGFPFASSGKVPERRCVQRQLIREKPAAAPVTLTLQGVLDRHGVAPAGYRLIAAGPIPALHEGLGVNSVDPGSIFIAYRLERQ
jgi:hypothetical protein